MDTSSGRNRVSVVIPAHNAASTLGAAIESALAQSRPPAETIVVDDGSTDDTAGVAADFPSVRVIHQATGGPSMARNRGIQEASGDWIAFLDSDDRWHPDKLADQLATAERAPGVTLIATDWQRWAPEFPPLPPSAPVTFLRYRDILVLNRFQTSTVLVRADTLRDIGGFDPALDGAEDWDLWLRCSTVTGIATLDAPYV